MPTRGGEAATVELYTDFSAAAGQRIGELSPAVTGVARYAVAGDGKLSLAVRRDRWMALGGDVRRVLRVTWPEGTVDEFRVARVRDTSEETVIELDALPIFDELVTGGPIVRVVGGLPVTRLAAQLPLDTWLSSYVTPHASATRIGLAVGTLERNPTLPGEFDAATPGAVIRTLFAAAGLEVELVRTSESVWTLNGRLAIGSSATPITLRPGRNQLALSADVDDGALATVVIPLGDAASDTGDRATIADVRYTVAGLPGSGWVMLQDPDTALSPIQVDTQWVGAAVRLPDGTRRTILDSRVSDGAVQLATTAGLVLGDRIGLVTASGDPLVEVFDTTSIVARGRRVVPKIYAGLRGEANELTNGRFATALAGWSVVNAGATPMYAEYARADLGLTLTGQANGARSAGTGTGTPLALKGLTAYAGKSIRTQDRIVIGGVTLSVTADAVPDTSGALTLSVSALPATYADNTAFTLQRVDIRTLTLDGDQSALSPALQFRDSNTDQLVTVTGTLASTTGGYTSDVGVVSYVDVVSAGKVRLSTSDPNTDRSWITWASRTADIYTLSDPVLSFTVGSSTGTITISGSFGGTPAVGTRVRYYANTARYKLLRVTAISGGTLTVVSDDGLPIVGWSGVGAFEACNVVLVDGSTWTCTMPRETRTLLANGTQTSGATTLSAKAQANIATRNWVATDTITLVRSLTGTLDLTSVGSVTTLTETDPDTGLPVVVGYQLTATFAAATSTMDEIATGDWPSGGPIFQASGSAPWRLQSLVSTTATFQVDVGVGNTALPTGVVSASWSFDDTYSLSGTASWGSNGRVTLTLASAIPTGRSYARGLTVRANWHTAGCLRLHTAVVAAATTVQISGVDNWTAATLATSSQSYGVYRVMASGSTIPIPGNTLIAAAPAVISGTGTASVTVTAANANAIADGDAVTIARPALLRTTDAVSGSAVRLIGSATSVLNTTPALAATAVPILVPVGTTRTVTLFVTFSLAAGTYTSGQQPIIALIDGSGTVLNTATISAGTVSAQSTPTIVRLIVQATLTASTSLSARLVGGSTDATKWIVVLDAMLTVTARNDVPFTATSWANQLAQRGADVLALQRIPVATVTVDVATLRRWSDAPATTAPLTLGQPVVLPALGLTRRVLVYERSLTNPQRGRVEVGTVQTDLTRRVAAFTTGS